ncbi:MAG: PorV/PorQ family protein [Bacteroidia bacterium]|nr:PorV/PorQ family protein [Bacteroidia bacterium]
MKKIFLLAIVLLLQAGVTFAGNPERAGQAGATQLLINPWARSSGMNGINIGSSYGIEALGNNPAGLGTTKRTELVFAHTNWLTSADISINTFGLSQSLKGSGVIGIYVSAFDMGEFIRTTEDSPDGGLGTFSPSLMNMGVSYAKKFTDHIYVGATVKIVQESIPDASAGGVAFDAGVQYRTNLGMDDSLHSDRLKLGVSIRNIGTTMKFDGDGLSLRTYINSTYQSQVQRTAAQFEMPSQLSLGASYDFYLGMSHRLSVLGSFISNTFTLDQFGGGVEYKFKEYLMVRYSYLYEKGLTNEAERQNAFTGHALGATLEIPFKTGKNMISRFGVDYSYRTTWLFKGSHVIGVRVDL